MAGKERTLKHPINNKNIADKIRTLYLAGKPHTQVEDYAVTYAKTALAHYWHLKPQSQDEQEFRLSEIKRWAAAMEWHNAGLNERLITALSQDANMLRLDPERNRYELGIALGNIAGLLTQQIADPPAETKHPKPKMLK